MNEENLKDELKPFYEKGDCCSWIVELRKDKYQLQQENKQLKEEIEELKQENEKLTQLWLESQTKRRTAIEYINKRMVHEGEYYFRKAKHFKNTEFGKDLLQILGDKENDI